MAANRELKITVLGDSSKANKALGSVEKKSGKLRKGLGKLGRAVNTQIGGALAVGGVAGIVGFGKSLFDMSSELESTRNKISTVFGDSIGIVQKWADTSASKMGLTSTQAQGLAASFGDLLIPMGFTRDQAAKMSTDVVGLSGALSQWSNGQYDAAQVSEILSKAMLGEREGLKSLGISISEADVQARLLKKGQQDLTGAQLEQAKATATQELIFEKSQDAQRAYAEGTNKLATAQAQAKAKWEQLKETLATKLVPALIQLGTTITTEVLPRLLEIKRFVEENKTAILAAAAAVGTLTAAWVVAAKGTAALKALKAALVAVKAAMALALGPVGLVVIGLAALAAGLIYAYQNSEEFRRIVKQVMARTQEAFENFRRVFVKVFADVTSWIVTKVIPKFQQMWQDIKPVLEMLWEKAQEIFQKIMDFIVLVVGKIEKAWKAWGDDILSFAKKTWENIKQVIEGVLDVIAGIVKTVTGVIKGDWRQVWEGVKQITSGLWKAIKGVIKQALETVKGVIKGALDVVQRLWGRAWEAVKGKAQAVWIAIKTVISGAINGVKGAISDAMGAVRRVWAGGWSAIKRVVSGVWETIKGIVSGAIGSITGMVDRLFRKVRSIPGKIRGAIGSAVKNLPGASLLSKIPGLAHGGTVTRSGLALVGEEGPELLSLRRGASVIPLDKAGSGGGDIHHHYNIQVAGTAAPMKERDLFSVMRRVELLHG